MERPPRRSPRELPALWGEGVRVFSHPELGMGVANGEDGAWTALNCGIGSPEHAGVQAEGVPAVLLKDRPQPLTFIGDATRSAAAGDAIGCGHG